MNSMASKPKSSSFALDEMACGSRDGLRIIPRAAAFLNHVPGIKSRSTDWICNDRSPTDPFMRRAICTIRGSEGYYLWR